MRIKLTILSVILCCAANVVSAKEPTNLDFVKRSLIKYHDNGEYERDQARVIDKAMQYLKTRIIQAEKLHSIKKMAIVLDIDETSLSNYPNMVEMSFGGTLAQIIAAENKGVDPAINSTLMLYRYAKANDIAVFFVTGRTESAREPTERNLNQAGFKSWDGLIFKPADYHQKTVAIYKTAARTSIEQQGYEILLNIGDQKVISPASMLTKHLSYLIPIISFLKQGVIAKPRLLNHSS